MNLRLGTLISVVLWLGHPAAVRCQNASGAVAGVVRDAEGASLPGVKVEVLDAAVTEKSRSTFTDAQGAYKMRDLRAGTYVVMFGLSGFRSIRREGIELEPPKTITVNVTMQRGTDQEMATASEAMPSIDTQSVSLSAVTVRQAMDALPTVAISSALRR